MASEDKSSRHDDGKATPGSGSSNPSSSSTGTGTSHGAASGGVVVSSGDHLVDLDQPEVIAFTGGSAAYGQMAFPQGDVQAPATFVTFDTPNQPTWRSVDVHHALDQNNDVVRSVHGGFTGHGTGGITGGGGSGVADFADMDNPYYGGSGQSSSGFGGLSLESLSLKPARFGGVSGTPLSQSQVPSTKVNELGHLRPTFTAVEITSASDHPGLVEPPQPPGGYLEPAYHFFSRSTPRIILDTTVAVLGSAGVDCTLKHDKFRCSCVLYINGDRLPFSVRVFSTEGFDRRYAVEFQRRAGDVLLFNDVYRSAKQALEASGIVEGGIRKSGVSSSVSTSPLSTLPSLLSTLPPLPPLESIDMGDQTRLTCKNLVGMASSKFVDVKSQAVNALCDMTSQVSVTTASMMVSEGVMDTLVNELKSDFEDVHRPALTALANLSFRRKDICDGMIASDALKHLLKLAFSDTLQVVREAARCLTNMATCVGVRMDSDDLRSVVRHLISSDDLRARKYVQEMMATLRMTTV